MPPRQRSDDDPGRAGGSSRDGADEAHKRRKTEASARVQALDADGAREHLDLLADRWLLDRPRARLEDIFARMLANCECTDVQAGLKGDLGLRAVDAAVDMHQVEAIALYHRMRTLNLLGEESDLLPKMLKVMELIFFAKKVVIGTFQSKVALQRLAPEFNPEDLALADDLDARLGSWALRFRGFGEETNQLQKLIIHLLDVAFEKRYRKNEEGWLFEPIISPDGHATFAWRAVGEIKDFVYRHTSKELDYEMWLCLTHASKNASAAAEFLSSAHDYQLPWLNLDRTVFAFRNGVLLASKDTFYEFGSPEAAALSTDIIAAKYFDLPYDHHAGQSWSAIPTPNLERIMESQNWAPEVRHWMYVMLGRLLYDVNALDGWQALPFLLGSASSGKSTIATAVAKNFYMPTSVGLLSNNVEKTFGLSAFVSKLLFIGPEIKQDLKLDQAELQSIVSGEDVAINAKHKTARSVVWTAPGLLCGNVVPSWSDNSGSIQRRLLVFYFENSVEARADTKLGEKLAVEMPLLMCKCNRAYLEMARDHGSKSIWSIVPDYFKGTRSDMAASTNSLEAFLDSSDITIRADAYCPYDEFKISLKGFQQNNSYPQDRMTWEFFRNCFTKRGITKVKDTREYRGRTMKREFLVGLDVNDGGGGGEACDLG